MSLGLGFQGSAAWFLNTRDSALYADATEAAVCDSPFRSDGVGGLPTSPGFHTAVDSSSASTAPMVLHLRAFSGC